MATSTGSATARSCESSSIPGAMPRWTPPAGSSSRPSSRRLALPQRVVPELRVGGLRLAVVVQEPGRAAERAGIPALLRLGIAPEEPIDARDLQRLSMAHEE